MSSMTGNHLYDASSRLQDEDELQSVYNFWQRDQQLLVIMSQAQCDLYHITKQSHYLINASMHHRWRLTITSTSASPFSIRESICDYSRRPQLDLRCMDACDIGSGGESVLIALGVGQTVFLIIGSHLGYSNALWRQHSLPLKSDIMDGSVGARTQRNATLLVGTRAGTIHLYTLNIDDNLTVDTEDSHYKFRPRGSVCHLSFVYGSEFLCAYSNGDLILGDVSRMFCQPTRAFRGHCNHFRQGLVCTM